jgi:hypothetical protein
LVCDLLVLMGQIFYIRGWLDLFSMRLVVVCFVMMSRAFFLAVLPMIPSVFIHSVINFGSFGGFGIVA